VIDPDAGPPDLPDPAAPLPALPVCSACGHVRVSHWRGRCRVKDSPGGVCDCTGFTDRLIDPPNDHPLLNASEDSPP